MESSFTTEPVKDTVSVELKGKEKQWSKGRFRCLTDEILDTYHQMSVDENLWRKQYEEAAFRVYGTLPSGHGQTQTKKAVVQAERGYTTLQSEMCRRHYEEATFIVYGTQAPHNCWVNVYNNGGKH